MTAMRSEAAARGEAIYDLAIIGGGVNGTGIARDAAGRGLTVALAEKGDLAGATSSASTKLIHGGLRYLEHYEFRLVREALIERERLWRAAPHIIRPMRFVLPHHRGLRPAWLLRLGLFLYDHLGGRERLPATRALDLERDPAGAALKPGFAKGFEYSDCWVDDARLVALNARDAAERGARVMTRTEVVAAAREGSAWRVALKDRMRGGDFEIRARALVNAAGPWVAEVVEERLGVTAREGARLVRGSHIITRRLFDHDRAYIFQNRDGRIIFAIPYERDFTLIGTTDLDHEGDPGGPVATPEEIRYLTAMAGEYLAQPLAPEDVVATYSGVRPLYDDGASKAQEATRDYVLTLHDEAGQAPLLNIFGGKITTYRRLAEAALSKLKPHLPAMGAPWTGGAALPGGDFPVDGFEALVGELRAEFPFLAAPHASRLARAYGTRAGRALGGARNTDDLGKHFGADLYEAELRHLMAEEWAITAEDALWRRSKLGLRFTEAETEALGRWMADRARGA